MYCIVTVVRFVIILIKFYVCMYVCMYLLQVTLTVERSDAFRLLPVINSRSRSSSSTSNGGQNAAHRAQLTVCARTTATHSFRLVARRLGHVNFTVQVHQTAHGTSGRLAMLGGGSRKGN